MNKRIKKLWIKALLGGEYKQGTGALRIDGSFCCLGVLCDLHSKSRVGLKWKGDKEEQEYDGDAGTLPESVQEWAGLNVDDPKLGTRNAAWWNDNGRTFNFIANQIEKYL